MKRVLLFLLFTMTVSAQSKKPISGTAVRALQRPAAVTVQEMKFQSAALGREMPYRVILPAGYGDSAKRYPTLYLLHGLGGSYTNWETNTHLIDEAAKYDLLIVLVEGGNSWYVNSATVAEDKFEDYFLKDLIPEVDQKFRTLRTKFGRAVAGLSMGGFGAIRYALRAPQSFAFAGSLSGALDITRNPDVQKNYMKYGIDKIFAPLDKAGDSDFDIQVLAGKADAASLPYLYLACGTDDRFLQSNRELTKLLSDRKINYEYHEMRGAHDWSFWDSFMTEMLNAMLRRKFMRVHLPPSAH